MPVAATASRLTADSYIDQQLDLLRETRVADDRLALRSARSLALRIIEPATSAPVPEKLLAGSGFPASEATTLCDPFLDTVEFRNARAPFTAATLSWIYYTRCGKSQLSSPV
jgi:hypothetical protein